MLFIHSVFLLCYFPKLASEMFCFLCILLFICLYAFFKDLLVEFSFVILEGHIYLYCLILPQYLLRLLSFANIGLFLTVVLSNLFAVVFFTSLPSIVSLCIFLSSAIWLVLIVSLFYLLSSFLIQLLYFFLGSFGGYQFCHWLILFLHKSLLQGKKKPNPKEKNMVRYEKSLSFYLVLFPYGVPDSPWIHLQGITPRLIGEPRVV